MSSAGVLLCGFAVLGAFLTGCSTSPQAKHDRFIAEGKKQLDRHDYARAVLQFKNAAQALPNDPEEYYLTGMALLGMGDVTRAVLAFKKTNEIDPKHIGAQLKLAELMARSDDRQLLAESEKRVRAVLELSPGNVDALNILATASYTLGHPDDSETYLNEALAKSPADVRSYANLAAVELAQGHLDEAEKTLSRAIAAVPGSAPARVALGRLYVHAKRPMDAEAQFQKAAELDPKDGAALLDLARTQNVLGKSDEAEKTYRRLSELQDPRYKPLHAVFLYQSGKTAQAIAEFESLAKQDPGNRDLRARLIAAYLSANQRDKAEKILNDAIKKNPRDADALLERSHLLLNSGRIAEAQTDLTTVLHFMPNDARVHYLLSRVYFLQDSDVFRREELNQALRLDPSLLHVRIELADVLINSKAAKSAVELLDAAPDDQKNLLATVATRNWALIAEGDLAAARTGIAAGLARSKAPVFKTQEGILKINERDLNGGRAILTNVLAENPDNTFVVQELANSYFKEKKDAAGIDVIRQSVAKVPNSSALRAYLGQILLMSGDRIGARAAFEQALKVDSAYEPAAIGLAMIDSADGQSDAARGILHALTDRPRPNSLALVRLGQIEESANNYPAAIAAYRRAADLRANDWVARNNLANCLIATGQFDEALKYAQEAKELAPQVPPVSDTIAWVMYNKGMYSAAVKELESSQNGASALSRFHLAMAYFKSGDVRHGNAVLQSALKLDPRNPIAAAAQQLARDAGQAQ